MGSELASALRSTALVWRATDRRYTLEAEGWRSFQPIQKQEGGDPVIVVVRLHADTAIPETIRRMKDLAGGLRLSLSAKIAGGANMFAHISPNVTNTIGEQNVLAVEKTLAALEIPILGRHLGGTLGRRMVVEVENGVVQIHVIGQPVFPL